MITPSLNNSWQYNRFVIPGSGRSSIRPIYYFSAENNTDSAAEKSDNEKEQPKENSEPPKNILVVEDTFENQFLAKKFLTKAGYEVEIAENGVIAVEKFNTSNYDLILMDIYMPEMDGFEATEKIRSIEKEQGVKDRVPIIAFTAHAVEGYEEKCLEHEMDDFITKPIKKKDFLSAVANWA